jgi:hypothetical protein
MGTSEYGEIEYGGLPVLPSAAESIHCVDPVRRCIRSTVSGFESCPLSSTRNHRSGRCAVWARSRSDRRARLFLMVMAGVGVPSRTRPLTPVSAPAMRRAQPLGRSAKSKTHPLSTSLADTEIVVAHRESMEPDIALLDDPDRR